MNRFKKYFYRFAIATGTVIAIGGYIVTWDMYRRIEGLEKQIHAQEQRLQRYETIRDQVKALEQRVNTATEVLKQYEAGQMNGNGYQYKTLENHLSGKK